MDWKPIKTMPRCKIVQIGNRHWTTLAERKRDTELDAEWLEILGDELPWEEITATHWREYDAPPAI